MNGPSENERLARLDAWLARLDANHPFLFVLLPLAIAGVITALVLLVPVAGGLR